MLKKSLSEDGNTIQLMEKSGTITKALRADKKRVVFLFNREREGGFHPEMIGTDKEESTRAELEKRTRKEWHKELQAANDKLLEDSLSDEQVEQVAKDTEMRAIYPVLHASHQLNFVNSDDAEHDAESAKRVFELSNIPWLLGLLAAINRDNTANDLHHVSLRKTSVLSFFTCNCDARVSAQTERARLNANARGLWPTRARVFLASGSRRSIIPSISQLAKSAQISTVVLPELRDKLQGSLDDAKQTDRVPQALLHTAQNMLKAQRTRESPFNKSLTELKKKVKELVSESTGVSAPLRDRVSKDSVDEFMQGDGVRAFLKNSRERETANWPTLRKKLTKAKGLASALKAIEPDSNYQYPRFKVLPLAFALYRGVMVDFEPLIKSVQSKVRAFQEDVIHAVVEVIDKVNPVVESAASTEAATILMQTYVESDVAKSMEQRFSKKKFFSSKQRSAALVNGTPEKFLKKEATALCGPALTEAMRGGRSAANTLPLVLDLVKHNLERARQKWELKTTKTLQNFLKKQFDCLETDLDDKLLKKYLTDFLKHVVQTHEVQTNSKVRDELSRYVGEVDSFKDTLYALWTRAEQDDPAELVRAFVRRLEHDRQIASSTRLAVDLLPALDPRSRSIRPMCKLDPPLPGLRQHYQSCT